MHLPKLVLPCCIALTLFACKDGDPGGTSESSSSGSSTTSTPTTLDPTTGPEPTTAGPTSSTTTADSSTGEPSTGPVDPTTGSSSTATTTTGDPIQCVPLQCDGGTYACGDCIDNDGDGKLDTADPECVSPCDDKEDTFATGLPGDNMDPCKQDCFFDGNSGGGAGDCAWNLKCDPKSPGGDKCPYDPKAMCAEEQSQECVETCQVPNGCDCFGCCTVSVDGVSYDIFLGDANCSIANIDSCLECTKNEDCDDVCDPVKCEVCFGETEPPPGCDMPTCDGSDPCKVDDMGGSNCPEGTFCSTGCCVPIEPG
jgi:hypothetical protein